MIVLINGILFNTAYSQIQLQEGFTAPFTPSTSGWIRQNLSAAANPTISWFQGTSNNFPSHSGGPNDYFGTGFLTTKSPTPPILSVWLITPTVTIEDGAVLEFYSRTMSNPSSYPDRLEVYYSTAGTGTNVGASPTSLGTFSTLLISINPSLTSTGYPNSWSLFSATISGVPSPTTGRIGFRYHIPNGGSAPGGIGDFVGIDEVKYSGACSISLPSFTACANSTLTISPLNLNPTNTFTWLPNNSNNASLTITPTATSVYTLSYSANARECLPVQSTVSIGSQLSIFVHSTKNPICNGESATLTPLSGASSYTWTHNGSNSNSVSVSPSSTTVYTVTGVSSNSQCAGVQTIAISVFPTTTINTTASPAIACAGKVASVTASGGISFLWYTDAGLISQYPTIVSSPTTVAGNYTFTLVAVDNKGCSNSKTVSLVVNPSPTITIGTMPSSICVGGTISMSASGGNSYQWSGVGTSSLNPYLFTPTSPGFYSVVVNGYSSVGCAATATSSLVVVGPVLQITTPTLLCEGDSIYATVVGGTTYTWNNVPTNNSGTYSSLAAQAGTYSLHVSATDPQGCIGSASKTIVIDPCTSIEATTYSTAIAVMPNPFRDFLLLKGQILKYQIYDLQGNLVIEGGSAGQTIINTSDFATGVYFLIVRDLRGIIHERLKILKE